MGIFKKWAPSSYIQVPPPGIDVRPTENGSTRLYKMAISQLLLSAAGSNLVGRNTKCNFIINFSLFFSIRLCWREIRPDGGKNPDHENEFVAVFSEMRLPREADSDKLLCC